MSNVIRDRNAKCHFSSNVDTGVLNDKKQAPIHLVTELNKVSVLEVMSKYKDRIDIQQGGEHGRTALHLAAIYDHEECAQMLVSLRYIIVHLIYNYHISWTIRRTFFPDKCDLKSTCVFYAEGKYLFPNL